MAYDPIFGNSIDDCSKSDEEDLTARMFAAQEETRVNVALKAERDRKEAEARAIAAAWAATEFSEPLKELEDQAPAGLQFAAE